MLDGAMKIVQLASICTLLPQYQKLYPTLVLPDMLADRSLYQQAAAILSCISRLCPVQSYCRLAC